jgi:hypothetical protein
MLTKIALTIFIILPSILYSQPNKYFDAPFGGGLGYVPAWYIPNIDPINSELSAIGMSELSTSGFYSSGIAGFIYIGFVKYLRVGGMGFSGSQSEIQQINNENREVVYSLGGGGLSVEYTIPVIRDVGLSVGAVIGGGTLELELYRNSGIFTWEGVWGEFNNTADEDYHRTISNSFWMFTPTVNLDIPVSRFVLVRIGGGYQLTFNDDWTVDNDQALSNVPSDFSANSFFVQSGIFVGFFSF